LTKSFGRTINYNFL